MRFLYRMPTSLADAQLTAHMGLLAGRYDITTYTMVDGREVRAETGFAPIKRGMEAFGQAAVKVVASFEGFAHAMAAHEEFGALLNRARTSYKGTVSEGTIE